MKLRFLYISANYKESKVIRVERERKIIYQTLEKSPYNNMVEFKEAPAVERRNLHYILAKFKPHIIHISGHGEEGKGPLFEGDEFPEITNLEQDLINILKNYQNKVKFVFFNCCNCAGTAKKASEFIDCTIGPKVAVNDDEAIAFTKGFYELFFLNDDILVAFKSGVRQYGIAKYKKKNNDYEIYFKEGVEVCKNLESIYKYIYSDHMKIDIEALYYKYLEIECGYLTLNNLPVDEYMAYHQFPLEEMYVPLYFEEIIFSGLLHEINEKKKGSEVDKDYDYNSTLNKRERIPLKDLLAYNRLLILAPPGSGKTTLLKRIALSYGLKKKFKDDIADKSIFPFFIRCRQLNDLKPLSILESLVKCSVFIEFEEIYKDVFFEFIKKKIEKDQIIILIDGLDEITTGEMRILFISKLKSFLSIYPKIKVIITSREPGFRIIGTRLVPEFKSFTISDLYNSDIELFIDNWLKKTSQINLKSPRNCKGLLEEINHNPQVKTLAKNPLLLTTLMLVRRWLGSFPKNRTVLYQYAIELLLSHWNIEGHIPLDLDEAYAQLSFVALKMMYDKTQRITLIQLEDYLRKAREELPAILGYTQTSIPDFIEKVELRSSILIRSGSTIKNGLLTPFYEFKHLSFLEFLAAKAITKGYYENNKRNLSPLDLVKNHLEDELWREIIPLVGAFLETGTESYHEFLLNYYRNLKGLRAFSFISILSQCLIDNIQIIPSLAREIIYEIVSLSTKIPDYHFKFILQGKFKPLLIEVAYNIYNKGNYTMADIVLGIICMDHLNKNLNDPPSPDLFKLIKPLISHEEIFYRILGWSYLDYNLVRIYLNYKKTKFSEEMIHFLSLFEEKAVESISPINPGLYSIISCFSLLGRIRKWESNFDPKLLSLLFNIYQKSKDVLEIRVVQAISVFPINIKNLNSLPPTKEMIKFIDKSFSINFSDRNLDFMKLVERLAALVLSVYLNYNKYSNKIILNRLESTLKYIFNHIYNAHPTHFIHEIIIVKNLCKVFGEAGKKLYENVFSQV